MKNRVSCLALAVAGSLVPFSALATNGYFAHGYGIQAKGMAGVGIALPQDSLAAATNPAGIAFIGSRMDLGGELFAPRRSSEIVDNVGIQFYSIPSLDGSYSGDGKGLFVVPEFGYNRMINSSLAVGLAVYGNGGMNTTYNQSPFTMLGGSSPAGVDLVQLFIAPTVAYKLNANNSVGLSLNLAHQRFSARGLEPFALFSTSPDNVSNVGTDSSSGVGVRVGWTGQVSESLTIGATYQSKTHMGKFDKYSGLFAEQGAFDIPANYGVGIAVKASPRLTIAADLQRIEYGGIPSIANSVANLFSLGQPLGGSNGPGFGWRDMTVFKLGASWKQNDQLTLRAGYSSGRQPIPAGETFFNILAPGVIEKHLTLGATWQIGGGKEISAYYMHALNKNVAGSGSLPLDLGGGEASLRMHQNAVGLAVGWRL
ncbi:MAG: outer membrane protein transport protein [Quisquiliibacterium sp.]